MRRRDRLLLALVRAGGGEHRPAVERRLEAFQLVEVDGRRRRVDLQVADRVDVARAERREAERQSFVLRQDDAEAAEQRHGGRLVALPAAAAAVRQAAVDQRDRNVARRRGEDERRPDLRFGEHGEIGLPMFEEARRILRRVERHVLVHGARAKPPLGQPRGGHGAGGEQEIEIGPRVAERLDHRQHGVRSRRRSPHAPSTARRWGARSLRGRDARRAGGRSSLPLRSRILRMSGANGRSRLMPVR